MGGRGGSSGMRGGGRENASIRSQNLIEDAYKNINPNFNPNSDYLDAKGFNNNCVKCALAFEANMRGGDVEANPFKFGYADDINRSKNAYKAFDINRGDVWEVGRSTRNEAVKEINSMMKEDFGSGSRAILQIESKGLRHTMNVINQNGTVSIVDAQSGKHGSVSNMLKGLPTRHISIFRVDDRNMDSEFSRWAYRSRK